MTVVMTGAVTEGDGSPLHLGTQEILRCSLSDAYLCVHDGLFLDHSPEGQ